MTEERWERTQRWIEECFVPDAGWYTRTMRDATAAGLPSIDAGPSTAWFLSLLAESLGARLVIEIGTLAGATSAILARGLVDDGRVITVESNPKHLEHARRVLGEAGLLGEADRGGRVELRAGTGLAVLRELDAALGAASVDLIFLDAQRSEYLDMLPIVRRMLRPGGILAIDNALSAGRWLPDPPAPEHPQPDTMEAVCDAVRSDPAFRSIVMPVGNGVLLAVRGHGRAPRAAGGLR